MPWPATGENALASAAMPKTTPESHFLCFRETGEREELARSLELVAHKLMSVPKRLPPPGANHREKRPELSTPDK